MVIVGTVPQTSKDEVAFHESAWCKNKMCIIYVTYRTMLKYSNLFWGGNSLIASQIGQRETFDDLYRLTPSVLSRNETFPFSDRNDLCFKYTRPSLTLRNSSARCPPPLHDYFVGFSR